MITEQRAPNEAWSCVGYSAATVPWMNPRMGLGARLSQKLTPSVAKSSPRRFSIMRDTVGGVSWPGGRVGLLTYRSSIRRKAVKNSADSAISSAAPGLKADANQTRTVRGGHRVTYPSPHHQIPRDVSKPLFATERLPPHGAPGPNCPPGFAPNMKLPFAK